MALTTVILMGSVLLMLTTFPKRLKAARLRKGLSARGLDKLAGRPAGHCALIERNEFDAYETATVESYARALGVSPGWLAFGTEAPEWALDPNTVADDAPLAAVG